MSLSSGSSSPFEVENHQQIDILGLGKHKNVARKRSESKSRETGKRRSKVLTFQFDAHNPQLSVEM